MHIPELNLRRPWGRIAASCVTLLIALLLFRCGTDKDDNKDEGNKQTPPVNVPTDWDGQSDWQSSQWKVTDE